MSKSEEKKSKGINKSIMKIILFIKDGIRIETAPWKKPAAHEIPDDLKPLFIRDIAYFLVPFAAGASVAALFEVPSFAAIGAFMSAYPCGIVVYRIRKIRMEGCRAAKGYVIGYVKQGGLMGYISRGEDFINPFMRTKNGAAKRERRNIGAYVIRFDDGSEKTIKNPDPNRPYLIGDRVKTYFMNTIDGGETALHMLRV
jgi:hypothetical protein